MRWQNYRNQKNAKPIWSLQACHKRVYDLLCELLELHSVGANILDFALDFWNKVVSTLEGKDVHSAHITFECLYTYWENLLHGEFREIKLVLQPWSEKI